MSNLPIIAVAPIHLATLRAIRDLSQRGYPPTYAELMEPLGVKSKSVVAYHLLRCAQLGLVTLERARPRTMQLTSDGWKVIS